MDGSVAIAHSMQPKNRTPGQLSEIYVRTHDQTYYKRWSKQGLLYPRIPSSSPILGIGETLNRQWEAEAVP